ncbi:MAG: type IV secretion system DNA-binding domain-containing protein [Chitinophagales bacterium]|nr:type IV secretion system DNA-binding domain-containing protein [Chitinophagales bacterium]
MNTAEQATLYYYAWDYRHRGYYFYDTPISIEPPYAPYFVSIAKTVTDDSKVPSIFGQLKSIFNKEEPKQEEIQLPNPKALGKLPPLEGLRLSFTKNHQITLETFRSFVSMLSFTQHPVSMEIVATGRNIALQLVFCAYDGHVLTSHIATYFPSIITTEIDIEGLPFHDKSDLGIVDFGLSEEFIRPINTLESKIDSLTPLYSLLNNLGVHESVVVQTIFRGVGSPLAKDIPRAVTGYDGESFFYDAPEMPKLALQKSSSPLFSVILRIIVQTEENYKTQSLTKELTKTISLISDSGTNKLIPLSNEGYHLDWHINNVFDRTSNRMGMVLNVDELTHLMHIPSNISVSKLGSVEQKTKQLEYVSSDKKCQIGVNIHQGISTPVYLDTQMRLRHTHIIGATGTGKSTLMANMVLQDIERGIGCALFDPHGDIVNDILARIPDAHKDKVFIVDPSDADFPIGFNLLEANTEIEKIQLSSDLVAAFQQHATSWGDQMTAVLSSAINTFLESTKGGTLIELKRFLIESAFRSQFLESVEDATLLYYWKHEYPAIAGKIAPLLTRIDTFLRPKIIRYMLVQKKGLDMRYCIDTNTTVLIRLSQGLIGEENSYLLGSLLLSKINQVALGRQSQSKDERTPYYVYIDEFQHFLTPSIVSMLSGSRKYGIGLILAHQDLTQLDDAKVLNSVLSNPYTRICFRIGDADSVKLESSFSYFDRKDLQSLATGQALVRIGSASCDGNLQTEPLTSISKDSHEVREHIFTSTREKFCTPRAEVEEMINTLMSHAENETREYKKKTPIEKPVVVKQQEEVIIPEPVDELIPETIDEPVTEPIVVDNFEKQKDDFIKKTEEMEVVRKHRTLQNLIKTIAVQRGYQAFIEYDLPDSRRVDVALFNDDKKIAVEISDTNTSSYEVGNIRKCIDNGFQVIFMISESEKHLDNIRTLALSEITNEHHSKIYFLIPAQISSAFEKVFMEQKPKVENKVRGYRVKTNYVPNSNDDAKGSLTDIILSTIRRK